MDSSIINVPQLMLIGRLIARHRMGQLFNSIIDNTDLVVSIVSYLDAKSLLQFLMTNKATWSKCEIAVVEIRLLKERIKSMEKEITEVEKRKAPQPVYLPYRRLRAGMPNRRRAQHKSPKAKYVKRQSQSKSAHKRKTQAIIRIPQEDVFEKSIGPLVQNYLETVREKQRMQQMQQMQHTQYNFKPIQTPLSKYRRQQIKEKLNDIKEVEPARSTKTWKKQDPLNERIHPIMVVKEDLLYLKQQLQWIRQQVGITLLRNPDL